jgi:hypothetical protein
LCPPGSRRIRTARPATSSRNTRYVVGSLKPDTAITSSAVRSPDPNVDKTASCELRDGV